MKELTPEQIQENWEKLIQIVKDTFEEGSERREKLLNMYHYFEERMCMAPAVVKNTSIMLTPVGTWNTLFM